MNPKALTLQELTGAAACLALALLVHLSRLPLWITCTIAVAAAVRLTLAWRHRPLPSQFLRAGIAALAVAILFFQFHTFNGIGAGTALLAVMAGLKLLEARSQRDIGIIILIVYFLCLAALLAASSVALLAYLLALCWITTAALLRASVANPPGWPVSLRYSGRILSLALPFAVVLWLFFPRFNGPLWRLPEDAPTAISGLSDSMTPGDISELALSDDVAFRVRFEGNAPPPRERYWRGPVLHNFDGRAWSRRDDGMNVSSALRWTGPTYRYTLSLEPHRHNWIFALDWPRHWDPAHATLNRDYMLVETQRQPHETDVPIESSTQVDAMEPLSTALRRRDTRLPADRNPRTLELAQQLRATHPDDVQFAESILDMFRQQAFYYTLTPPQLAQDSVDEFLFDTKSGFCAHYASAFAVLMRAAGIPTRVVTGYQGGSYNRFAGYWIVRQSDAHAWDESWIEGRGWVRFDPTAAIAPERIEQASAAILGNAAALAGRWYRWAPWLDDFRNRLDALHELWRRAILSFDQQAQMDLLERLGVSHPDIQKLVLTMAIGLALALAWLAWQVRFVLRPDRPDPLLRGLARIDRRLAAIGLPRAPEEGVSSYAQRIAAALPELGVQTTALLDRYVSLRYGKSPDALEIDRFERETRRFRIKRHIHAS